MACKSLQMLLHEAFERVLTPEEQQRVDGHLGGCEACQADAALLKLVVQAVETTPIAQPSEAFTLAIMDQLPTPIRILGFIPVVVFRSVMITLGVVAAALTWTYRTPLMSSAKSYAAVDKASSPVLSSLQQAYTSLQAMAGSALEYLPMNPLNAPEENPFISVAIAIGIAFVVLRLVNGFESPDWELDIEMETEYSA